MLKDFAARLTEKAYDAPYLISFLFLAVVVLIGRIYN